MAHEHLSFKGIPIEGSMTDFCKKLKSKGFIPIDRENNIALFSGDFIVKRATIAVHADNVGNVIGVVVLFDTNDDWNSLVNIYEYSKDLYTRKYGTPIRSKEYNPARSNSNIALMAEVYNGRAEYFSLWKVTGGAIVLAIDKSAEIYKGRVRITYLDSQNTEAKIQNDLDDI